MFCPTIVWPSSLVSVELHSLSCALRGKLVEHLPPLRSTETWVLQKILRLLGPAAWTSHTFSMWWCILILWSLGHAWLYSGHTPFVSPRGLWSFPHTIVHVSEVAYKCRVCFLWHVKRCLFDICIAPHRHGEVFPQRLVAVEEVSTVPFSLVEYSCVVQHGEKQRNAKALHDTVSLCELWMWKTSRRLLGRLLRQRRFLGLRIVVHAVTSA